MRAQDSIRGRLVRNLWLVFAALASLCAERGRGAEEGAPPERVIQFPADVDMKGARLFVRRWWAFPTDGDWDTAGDAWD